MPKPKPGESQKDFVSRCIPALIEEGKPQDQAIAICYSMYEETSQKDFTGAMVGMFLPLPIAVALDMVARDLPFYVERTKAKDYHLTLAYLGDLSESVLPVEEIKTAVQKFANTHNTITGRFGGIGRMSKSDDGKNAIYANFDSPELPQFRQDLVDALQASGIFQDPEHGFIPHITLGYMWDDIEETPHLELPDIEFGLDKITLALGDDRLHFDLQKATTEKSFDGFSVVTDKEGKSRWISISSTAYEDRSGQIVSQKALAQAVAINDYRSYHGPLRWWHLGGYDEDTLKATPGFDIGDCDFSMPYGKFLVESGTFYDERFADVAKNGNYELSIRFLHPRNEPDSNGIFENVVIFERSLLPRGKADNRFTSFLVSQKESTKMDYQAKVKEFTEKLDDPDFVIALTAQLDERQNALDKSGVRSKEKDEAAGILAKIKSLINPEGSTAKEEPKEPVAPVAWVPTEDSMKSIIGAAVAAAVSATQKSAVEQDTEKAIRKAQENVLSRILKLETDLADTKKELVEIDGLPGYRPTQDNGNVTEKSQHVGPDNSGVGDFVARSTSGQAQGAKVS